MKRTKANLNYIVRAVADIHDWEGGPTLDHLHAKMPGFILSTKEGRRMETNDRMEERKMENMNE